MASTCARIAFESPSLRLGTFRCPVTHAAFETLGDIDTFHVCFPRTSVWLEHEGAPRFVADASRATLYNPRQVFRRAPISPDGDHTDWIAIGDSLARDLIAQFDRADAESNRVFRFGMAGVRPSSYLAQRRLFTDVELGLADRFEVEERAARILSAVLAQAYTAHPGQTSTRARTRRLVESAREAILESLCDNLGVADVARRLGVSVFHLCRVFRAHTGMTLHEYRRDMRLRAALGLVAGRRGQLSSLALQVGFCSHAHFTVSFRRAFGVSPAAAIT
jgi:AraC family transcriptional regulator